MGLLDGLNMNDPQTLGLLGAAAQMLQQSGPSLMPHSFGQVMGAGLQGMVQGRQQAQAGQLADLKIRDAQSDLANQDMLRERQRKIQEELLKFGADGAMGAQPAVPMPAPQSAGTMISGMLANGGQMPMPPAPGAPPAPDIKTAAAQRLLSEAAIYQKYGDFDSANKRYEAAIKLQPKFATDFRVAQGADGQLHNYLVAEDGTLKDAGVGVKPDMQQVTLGDRVLFTDKNKLDNGQSFTVGQSPDSKASNGLGWARLNFDKAQADDGGLGPLTTSAVDNAAKRYNFDGTLPPMGMGRAAAAGRSAILNRAAELQAGVDGTDQRKAQLGNKIDLAAQGAAVKSFATGKDGQAVQSANTALNHLDTIRQLAEAQKNGDMRAFNAAARTLGAAFGSAAPTNLNAALTMVAPEISKAVIGAGGTGHERDQALAALNPNGSPDQIIGAAHTMQELFGGRLTEAKRTYERTTKRQDFDTLLSPAAQAVLKAKTGHAVNVAAIPQGAVNTLKLNPKLRDAFDEKYGAGAAAAVLGK